MQTCFTTVLIFLLPCQHFSWIRPLQQIKLIWQRQRTQKRLQNTSSLLWHLWQMVWQHLKQPGPQRRVQLLNEMKLYLICGNPSFLSKIQISKGLWAAMANFFQTPSNLISRETNKQIIIECLLWRVLQIFPFYYLFRKFDGDTITCNPFIPL